MLIFFKNIYNILYIILYIAQEKIMEEKGLVKKELNFFQRIRKSLYLIGMSAKKAQKYFFLPEYLKQDDDVVNAVLESDEKLINRIPIGKAEEVLKQKPQLLNKIYNIKVLNQVIDKNPELISYYECEENLDRIYNLIYNEKLEGNRSFIKYLSKDLQIKLLTEEIEYMDRLVEQTMMYNNSKKTGKFDNIKKYLTEFSEESIISLAIQDNLRILELKKNVGVNIQKNIVSKFDIQSLSLETQLKLLLISNDFDDKVSNEAMLKFVNGNPLLFDRLSNKLKEKIISENPELLSKMPYKFQEEYVKSNPQAFKNSNLLNRFNIRNFDTPEEAIDRIILIGQMQDEEKRNISEYIWEMGQFNPELVKLVKDDKRNELLVKKICEQIIKRSGTNEITEYLESVNTEQDVEKINRIAKLILNEDIMKAVPSSAILDYARKSISRKISRNSKKHLWRNVS